MFWPACRAKVNYLKAQIVRNDCAWAVSLLYGTLRVALTRAGLACCLLAFSSSATVKAQDRPYFVTYSDDMEERGEMEIESKTALAGSDRGTPFGAMSAEIEYGV